MNTTPDVFLRPTATQKVSEDARGKCRDREEGDFTGRVANLFFQIDRKDGPHIEDDVGTKDETTTSPTTNESLQFHGVSENVSIQCPK